MIDIVLVVLVCLTSTNATTTTSSAWTSQDYAYGGYYGDQYYSETVADVDCDEFEAHGTCEGYCNMLTDACGIICAPQCETYGDCGDFFEACPC